MRRFWTKGQRFWRAFGILIVIISLGIAVFVVLQLTVFLDDNQQPITNTIDLTSEKAPIQPSGTLTSRFLFSGTVVTARAVENEARDSNGDVNWASVFSQFDSFGPEKYREWFIDMECPVTTNFIPYRTQVDNTVFNCPPSVFPEMSKFITVANIANNHTRDQGDDGFTETRQSILDGGLQVVGNWDPGVSEDACEVMSMTYEVTDNDSKSEVEMPIAVCAFHYFERAQRAGELDIVAEYAKVMPVIGLMQVGAEYRPNADERQIAVARELIDNGAEFVVGNSPHWVQNTEVYKDKLIVYSTGNFIFDQIEQETNRGLSLDVLMQAENSNNVSAWTELAKECKPEVFKDSCFELARERGLEKISFKYTFDILASSGGFREITRLASPDVQEAVEVRANWSETLELLGQSQ